MKQIVNVLEFKVFDDCNTVDGASTPRLKLSILILLEEIGAVVTENFHLNYREF